MSDKLVNKVVHGNRVLIDLTEDTVTPEKLAAGYTAHDKSGAPIVGIMNTDVYGVVYTIDDFECEDYATRNGSVITCASTQAASMFLYLDQSKTYAVTFDTVNCGFMAFDEEWGTIVDINQDGKHSVTISNTWICYLYPLDTSAMRYEVNEITVAEIISNDGIPTVDVASILETGEIPDEIDQILTNGSHHLICYPESTFGVKTQARTGWSEVIRFETSDPIIVKKTMEDDLTIITVVNSTGMYADLGVPSTFYVDTIKVFDNVYYTNIFNDSDTSDATATDSDIISGKTAYVNGAKITGTLQVQRYYTGSSSPTSSLGNDGDLYLVVEG